MGASGCAAGFSSWTSFLTALLAASELMSFCMKSPMAFAGGFCSCLGSSLGTSVFADSWLLWMAACAAAVFGSSTVLTFLGSSALGSSLGAPSAGFAGSAFFALGVAFLFLAWGFSFLWATVSSTTSRVLVTASSRTNPYTHAPMTSQTANARSMMRA